MDVEHQGSEFRLAVRTLALTGRGLERAAAPLNLAQYRVLALIASAPERASRLAQRADVTKATMTGVIDALEIHGWIQRADVEGDRRGVSLALTDDGIAVLDQAEEAMAAWLKAVLDQAGPAAAAGVVTAMATLAAGLEAARKAPEAAEAPAPPAAPAAPAAPKAKAVAR